MRGNMSMIEPRWRIEALTETLDVVDSFFDAT
jgi:hypothetical protein